MTGLAMGDLDKRQLGAIVGHLAAGIRRKLRQPAAGDMQRGSDVVTVRLKKSDVPWHGILTAHASIMGTRPTQQDALYVDDDAVFAEGQAAAVLGVVCDGMGGMEDGERASSMAVESLRSEFRRAFADAGASAMPATDVRKFLDSAIRKLNHEIFNMGCDDGGAPAGGPMRLGIAGPEAAQAEVARAGAAQAEVARAGAAWQGQSDAARGMTAAGAAQAASFAGRAGTTLVASVVVNDRAYWASVGDSRIYIYRRGYLARLTRDHSYSLVLREMVRNGEIAEADAQNDRARNALISFIGMENLTIVDICESPLPLENGDIVLLCSDGLVKALTDEAIAMTMSRHFGNLNEMAKRLPMAAQDAKTRGLDNTSVVLLQFIE